jgi:hypothetical protein
VIYYYHRVDNLLEIFGKNEQANLSKVERNALAKVVVEIKKQLERGCLTAFGVSSRYHVVGFVGI